jgi:methylated-DNA-[protein]-cysteine S-methyltransferase
MNFTYVDSPVGKLLVAGDDRGRVTTVAMAGQRYEAEPEPGWRFDPDGLESMADQLHRYFARELKDFDLPLAPEGTPFQRTVWDQLQAIPYGETISYAELARRVGRPGAARAVGSANGRNPIAIVIPCHRVIASDGTLGGYGGGLGRKQFLLDLEAGRVS